MPRNGSGGYVPPAGQPVVSGTAISSTVFNALVADLGAELTKSICTDGQTPMTASLPMGNNKITGLAPGAVASDAVRLDQVSGTYLPIAGGTLSGPLILNNTVPIELKDAGGNAQIFVYIGSDNQVNIVNSGGANLRIFNQNSTSVLWSINNFGQTSQIGQISADTTASNATAAQLKNTNSGNLLTLIGQGANPNKTIRITNGNLEIANSAYNAIIASLSDAGAFSAVTVSQSSDERKKKLWQRLPHDFIAQLAGIKKSGLFTWKKGGAHGVGVGAQSLERILPLAVHTDERGAKTVNYGAAAMVSAVELARALVAQEKRLAALEAK